MHFVQNAISLRRDMVQTLDLFSAVTVEEGEEARGVHTGGP